MTKYDFNNPEDDLSFTVERELARLKLPPRKSNAETRDQAEQRRKFVACQIVHAIKRSN